jgi:hypothetical protein
MKEHQHNGMPVEDLDVEALSCPPKMTTLKYQWMKAYGNHFPVSDCNMEGVISFDCGVASIFGQQQAHAGDGDATIKYVNVIKDIFKLDYGPISTTISLMRCACTTTKGSLYPK